VTDNLLRRLLCRGWPDGSQHRDSHEQAGRVLKHRALLGAAPAGPQQAGCPAHDRERGARNDVGTAARCGHVQYESTPRLIECQGVVMTKRDRDGRAPAADADEPVPWEPPAGGSAQTGSEGIAMSTRIRRAALAAATVAVVLLTNGVTPSDRLERLEGVASASHRRPHRATNRPQPVVPGGCRNTSARAVAGAGSAGPRGCPSAPLDDFDAQLRWIRSSRGPPR
jgi:hypothetical protein